eukprot:6149140-Prymnesium_polylepis.3
MHPIQYPRIVIKRADTLAARQAHDRPQRSIRSVVQRVCARVVHTRLTSVEVRRVWGCVSRRDIPGSKCTMYFLGGDGVGIPAGKCSIELVPVDRLESSERGKQQLRNQHVRNAF